MTAATQVAHLLRERARSYARDAEGMARMPDLDPGDAAAMWTMARELDKVADEVEEHVMQATIGERDPESGLW